MMDNRSNIYVSQFQVLPYVVGSHMDDQYWNEPKCFNPERFLDSDGKILPPDHPTRTQYVYNNMYESSEYNLSSDNTHYLRPLLFPVYFR